MKHLRIIGLCLAAVFAVLAVAVSSASAASPEWGKCEAKIGGKYKDANCQEKASHGAGAFEWIKGAKLPNVPFTGHSEGSGGVLSTGGVGCSGGTFGLKRVPRAKCVEGGGEVQEAEPGGHLNVECEAESNSGEQVGKDKVANVNVTFTGCKLFGSSPCTSEGAAEGEVRTNTLKGELGYINKATHEVGLKLEPATKHGNFAKFICLTVETVVGVGDKKEGAYYLPETKGGNDQIISPITPVDTMTSTFTQVYSVNYETHPQNVPDAFEGKPISLLEDHLGPEGGGENGNMWSPAGEEITNVNTASSPGEIKG